MECKNCGSKTDAHKKVSYCPFCGHKLNVPGPENNDLFKVDIKDGVLLNLKSDLSAVTIPDNVTTIGENAFTECPNLKTLIINRNVKNIKKNAFMFCIGLDKIIYSGTDAEWRKLISGLDDDLSAAFLWTADIYTSFDYGRSSDPSDSEQEKDIILSYEETLEFVCKNRSDEILGSVRYYAEDGDKQMQCELGYCYLFGKGVKKDSSEAAKWFMSSVAQDFAEAQLALGDLYYAGDGVRKNLSEAAKYFLLAAKQGDDLAQFFIGDMYEHGEGVKKDDDEALKWYCESAKQGNSDAQKALKKLCKKLNISIPAY